MLSGFVKGGLLANFVDVKSSFSSDDNPANSLNKGYDSTEFAQFVEANGQVAVKLNDAMSLVASAMVLWINGVSDPGDSYSQVADRQATSIDANSDALFYGGSLGLKINLN